MCVQMHLAFPFGRLIPQPDQHFLMFEFLTIAAVPELQHVVRVKTFLEIFSNKQVAAAIDCEVVKIIAFT